MEHICGLEPTCSGDVEVDALRFGLRLCAAGKLAEDTSRCCWQTCLAGQTCQTIAQPPQEQLKKIMAIIAAVVYDVEVTESCLSRRLV